jgi:hypothetical protein
LNSLTVDDQREFLHLRCTFKAQTQVHRRDRRLISFSQDFLKLLDFIERSLIGYEDRSILTGLAFSGPYICVHTRQLKALIGRCKSSINGSFQQLRYVSIRAA